MSRNSRRTPDASPRPSSAADLVDLTILDWVDIEYARGNKNEETDVLVVHLYYGFADYIGREWTSFHIILTNWVPSGVSVEELA